MSIIYSLTIWLRRPKLKLTTDFFNHDFICISETYFDSLVLEGDGSFQLNGYNLRRADHPRNSKRGGVCIYYKEFLCVCEVKLSSPSQSIISEVSLRICKRYIGVVYRSPTQENAEFEKLLSNFDELLSETAPPSSLFTIILGDFNAKSWCW